LINRWTPEQVAKFKKCYAQEIKKHGKPTAQAALRKLLGDPKNIALFAYIVLPHMFRLPFTKKQFDYMDHLQIGAKTKKSKASLCYRGFGKSTIGWTLAAIYECCYSTHKYIVVNAWNRSRVNEMIGEVKREFDNNKVLIEIYGDATRSKEEWSVEKIVPFGKTKIRGVTTKDNVRGLLFSGSRPNKIVSDDIIDDRAVRSETQREIALKWYQKALRGTLDQQSGFMELMNTKLHEEDIISTAMNGIGSFKAWDKFRVDFFNEDMTRNDEGNMSDEMLEELLLDPIAFEGEFQNNVVARNSGMVKIDDVHFFETLNSAIIKEVFIYADITHTAKTHSDYFAMAMAGKCEATNNIYIIDYFIDKIEVDKQADKLIEFYRYAELMGWTVGGIGYDSSGHASFGYWAIEHAKMKRGLYLPLEPKNFPGDKVEHLQRHVPIFKSGSLYMPKKNDYSKRFEDQLFSFPQEGMNDDAVDAVSGVLDYFTQGTGPALSF